MLIFAKFQFKSKTAQLPIVNPVCFARPYKKESRAALFSISSYSNSLFDIINLKPQPLPFLPTHRPHNRSGLQIVHRLFEHPLLYMSQPPHSEMYQ